MKRLGQNPKLSNPFGAFADSTTVTCHLILDHLNKMTSAHVLGVLDLTFLDIKEETDLERGISERTATASDLANFGPIDSPKKKKEEIRAIRLANNSIENLSILGGPLTKAGIDCSNILWIDLSFNCVKNVSESFLSTFPNVTTIYFHANRISKLSVVKKMSALSQLKSLSLYGNPVEEHKVPYTLHCI